MDGRDAANPATRLAWGATEGVILPNELKLKSVVDLEEIAVLPGVSAWKVFHVLGGH